MKKFFVPVSVYLCVLQTFSAEGQYYYYNDRYYGSEMVVEFGGSIGLMNSLTDIGGNKGIGKKFVKDINWKVSKPSFGGYIIVMYKEAIGARLEVTFGNIGSYDSILRKVGPSTFGRYERNLSFRSSITDIQLAAEVHPLFFKTYDEGEAPFLSPMTIK